MAELPATLVKKKNTKSVVWVYFGHTAYEKGVPVLGEEHRPVCRMCKKAVMCINVCHAKEDLTTNEEMETVVKVCTGGC